MVKKQKEKKKEKKIFTVNKLVFFLCIFSFFIFLFSFAVPAHAANGIRKTINFQGKLVDQNGLNVPNGSYTVVFTLYDDPSAGSNLWDETQSVTTTDGVFQVELGTVDTTLGNVNFNSDLLYLGIKVGTDLEMTPRIRFTAVPYAFNAQKVNGLNVTNESGNPFNSTTTFRIADGKTVQISNGLTLAGTDATTITFQGTDTYVGRGTTDTLTNKTIGSTGLVFSGATTDITTATDESLVFDINGTGNLIINSDFNSGVSIGSASNTPAVLSVSGGIGNNAAFIVNNTNDGDLFVASSSGTSIFGVTNAGGLRLGSSEGTNGDCLISGGNGAAATWGACSQGGAIATPDTARFVDTTAVAFQDNDTTEIFNDNPRPNITTDSTTAPVLVSVQIRGNVSNTTADAFLAARVVYTTDGSAPSCSTSTQAGQAMIGGFTTNTTHPWQIVGTFTHVPGVGGLVRYTVCTSALSVGTVTDTPEAVEISLSELGNSNSNWTLSNGVYVQNSPTADVLMGGMSTDSAKFAVLNMNPGSGTPTASLSAGVSGGAYLTATGTLQTTANQTLTVGGATTGNVLINPQGNNFVGIGTSNPLAPLDVRTSLGTVPTASFSANSSFAALVINNSGAGDLFTASSSGLNRFVIKQNGSIGVGTTLPIANLDLRGNGGYDSYVASLSGNTGKAILTVDNNGGGDLFTASKSGATKFTVLNSGDLRLANYTTAGGFLYTNNTGTVLQTLAGNSGECLKSAGGGTPTWGNCSGASASYWDLQNGLLYNGNLSVDFAIGGNTSTSAKFRVSSNGTEPTASVSGNTAKASLIVDNVGFGDLLTASKSGASKFTVLNSGDVRINNLLLCDVKTDATGLLLCGTDATGTSGGTNYLLLNNGAFSFINNTADVLIGGEATGSAKFAFMNLNGNSGLDPLASFSGTLRIGAKPNSSATQQTTWTKISQTTPGQIASGGTTNIASISAMASYNGSLYVGTYGTNTGTAEIYRYSGTNSTWTKVSQTTAGQIASGGTQNIGSVSAMTVFDGRLYAGTSKMNEAEVYRYEGGTSWTRISATTVGDFGANDINQDGVSAMGVYQGKLYVGTREVTGTTGGARLIRWDGGLTWTPVNTTAGQFAAAASTTSVRAVTSIVGTFGGLYLGLSKPGDADVVKYTGGTGATVFLALNAANLLGSYTINGSGTPVTAFDEVTAMTVYNGNLIMAMQKNNAAEVLAVNMQVGETGINTFSRLNNAAGQMTNGGTSNIDQVASLAVYNGLLYIGTREGNSAEIYRYTGGDQKFMKVSQTTAGTIASGGTSSIDGVVKLLQHDGDLYAGTMELGRTEVYKHTSSIDRSYALEFVANPQIAGGTQNSQINEASIFYLASASANLSSNNANTGAFIFSHGIQTRNGSYDVAEDYPTRDDTLEAGDVVGIDPIEKGFVKKSKEAYDSTVIGVYSSDPALRLSQLDAHIDGARAIPVALAGRVAVKVTTENGEIKPGDFLTASSRPGVAMRATKSGVVIGQAMGEFACENGELICTGKVLTYIKSASYLGSIASEFAGLELKEKSSGQELLAAVRTQSYTESTVVSEVVTDQLVAGLRIVSPEIMADRLQITTIESVEKKDIGIVLGEEGKLTIQNASSAAGVIFKGTGDAYFAGQVQAATLSAEKLIVKAIDIPAEAWKAAFAQGGLESIESRITAQEARLTNLETLFASQSAAVTPTPLVSNVLADMPAIEEFEKPKVDDTFATFSGKLAADKLQVAGSAIVEGILHVVDYITTKALIVDDIATFLGKVVFSGDVFFENHPTFNNDTAGIAIVKKGTDRVEVRFEKEYKSAPMVNVNLTLDEVSPMPGEAIENLVRRQEALEDHLLGEDVRYIVTKRTAKGFVILLDDKADEDVAFSWIVVAVDNPLVRTIHGDNSPTIKGHKDENTRPISSNIPTVIPTSSIEKREVEILPSPKELLDGKEVSIE